jgi:hypothetical protein
MHADGAIIRNIIETETCVALTEDRPVASNIIRGDEYPLRDADGYPELPACLDRRKPSLREAA